MRRATRSLKCIAGTLIILVVLYVAWRLYENHEGAQEWQRALGDLKQRGEPSDATQLIPPAVPDADNLGALPLLRYSTAPGQKVKTAAALDAALANIVIYDSQFPKFDWTGGKPVDQAAIITYLAACWHKAFPGKQAPAAPLDQFDALCPALGQLRAESAKRSVCRLEQDYTTEPVFDRSFGLTTDMIKLAKVANLHAVLALEAGQPDLALQDIDLMLKIDAGLRQQPTLVSGLVAIGVLAIELDGVWEGLENHDWSDAQLGSLQRELGSIDFLSDYQLCMRGEGLGFFAPTMFYLKDHQRTAAQIIFSSGTDLIGGQSDNSPPTVLQMLWKLTPPGCLDQTAARGVMFYIRAAREGVDVASHRVNPATCQALKKEADELSSLSLPNLLLRVSAKPVIGSASAFGAGQFHADAARIACMIERYRLVHGVLPSKLSDLPSADDRAGLPHDLCNGQPLHYAPRSNGTYLLYSVGWNQVDDQGQIAHRTDYPHSVDRENGDWVWPQTGYPGI